MSRFKTDENLHPSLADHLRTRGHDAVTVWDESLRGCSDAELAEVCRVENRVLVTLDIDFADIRTYPLRATLASSSSAFGRDSVGSAWDYRSAGP